MKRFYSLLFAILAICSCSKQTIKKKPAYHNPFYDKAYEYLDAKQSDSAFFYFNKAKDLFVQQKDSLYTGKCLENMGIISTESGDYFGGQELSLSALPYFDQNNKAHFVYLAGNFNNLGVASYRLKNNEQAIKFYDQAIQYSVDSLKTHIYLNNKASSYQELGKYEEAIQIYQQLLNETHTNQIAYARVLTNISFTKWLQNNKYNAAPELLKSLNIRKKENDLMGLNSSYAHLSDYYAQQKPDSALNYAFKMLKVNDSIKSPDDRLEAIGKLIRLSPSQSSKFFEQYQHLDDSLQTARDAAKNQFALVRYETEKHKADNLALQRDNTLLFGAVLIAILITIFLIFWYRKRKQKIEAKAQSDIRESQLKTSKKVHDVVANGLYRVITELENRPDFDKERALDQIDQLYIKSRDISYDIPVVSDQPFDQKIAALLSSFEKEDLKVELAGNKKALWSKVNSQIKDELEYLLQELMVNMDKHSCASHVRISFEEVDGRININYYDNGVGMPENLEFKNGLTNTENRINSIHGSITFENKVEGGLNIQLSFPIS